MTVTLPTRQAVRTETDTTTRDRPPTGGSHAVALAVELETSPHVILAWQRILGRLWRQ